MILFFNILKILGIILLCILGLFLLLILCVLFIPVRYQLKAKRKCSDNIPVCVDIKISWLLHLVTLTYSYPLQKYIKLKILGITFYSSEEKSEDENKSANKESSGTDSKEQSFAEKKLPDKLSKTENSDFCDSDNPISEAQLEEELQKKLEENIEEPTIIKFIKKFFEWLKNIKYTILKLYDKIKKIIKEIRYYMAVIRSDCFKRAFALCKDESITLLTHILPKKINGNFTVGTGNPASTAQILAVHGMLYPFIGNHISIIPDFDHPIFEGNLFLKGRITIFKILKIAIKIYFNKDIRRVIHLFKKGGSINGR